MAKKEEFFSRPRGAISCANSFCQQAPFTIENADQFCATKAALGIMSEAVQDAEQTCSLNNSRYRSDIFEFDVILRLHISKDYPDIVGLPVLPLGIPQGALVLTLSKKSRSYFLAGGKVRPTWAEAGPATRDATATANTAIRDAIFCLKCSVWAWSEEAAQHRRRR